MSLVQEQPAAVPTAPAVVEAPAPTVADVELEAEIADVFGLSLEQEGKPASTGEAVVESAPPVASPPPSPAVVAPAVVPPVAQPAPIPQAPATEELTPEQRLAANAEAATVDALKAKVAQLEAQIATPATPAIPAPAGNVDEPEFTAPQYQLQIPDEVTAAIFDENPATAKAGMQHLINGLAAHIHKTIITQTVLPLLRHHEQALKAPIEAEQGRQQAEQMRSQYYERHPTHNSPALQPIIAAETHALSMQFPQAAWDENFMDALGARVNAKIAEMATAAGLAPQPVVTPTPTPAVTPAAPAPAAVVPAKPAAMMPTGAPSPAASSEPDLADEVFSLFT